MKKIYKACEETEVFNRLLRDFVRESLQFKDYYGNPIYDERLLQPNQIEELKAELKDTVERYIYWNSEYIARISCTTTDPVNHVDVISYPI